MGFGAALIIAYFAFPLKWGNAFYLAWFSLVPLFLFIERRRHHFLWFCIFFSSLALLLFWINPVILGSRLKNFKEIVVYLLFFAFCGVGYGFISAVTLKLAGKIPLYLEIWFLAAAATTYEYLLTIIPSALPLFFGLTQAQNTLFIQSANVFGPWIITFLVFLSNYVVFKAIKLRRFAILWLGIIIFGVNYLYGFVHLQDFAPEQIACLFLVQPNIEFDEIIYSAQVKYFFRRGLRKLIYLSQPDTKCDLMIWPEISLLRYLAQDFDQIFEDFKQSLACPLLFGTAYYDYQNNSARNSILVLSEFGLIRDRYSKVKLFPKYEDDNYLAAEQAQPLMISKKVQKLGAMLCFESLFPQISRNLSIQDSQILVCLSNDAWFADTNWPYLHLAYSRFRAVENDSYMVFLSNNGPSAVFNPRGETILKLPAQKMAYAEVLVGLEAKRTLYNMYSDWFAWICGAYTLAILSFYFNRSFAEYFKRRGCKIDYG